MVVPEINSSKSICAFRADLTNRPSLEPLSAMRRERFFYLKGLSSNLFPSSRLREDRSLGRSIQTGSSCILA